MLRSATAGDRDDFAALQGIAHADSEGNPSAAVAAWGREFLDGSHPAIDYADITVVEDCHTGSIVSGLVLVPQKWSYGGIEFGVGRLELVATHPDYRRRGLISRQIEVLHDRSAACGHLMQVITDLMFFHQEFGYHAALVQRAGRGGWTRELPTAADDCEPVELRRATTADIPLLTHVDELSRGRSLLVCERDPALWRYELAGREPENMMRDEILVIVRGDRRLGYVVVGYGGIPSFPVPSWLPGRPVPESVVSISGLELLPEASWLDIVPSVVRQLAGTDGYMLWLGTGHPAYDALGSVLIRRPPNIGWFIRIPDLVVFLRHIAPVLERRLEQSDIHGLTGVLRLHFYTFGVRLDFRKGELVDVCEWHEHSRRESDASMHGAMFSSLLLGHAEMAELAPAYPDHRVQTQLGAVLLATLFPKQSSRIWPVI